MFAFTGAIKHGSSFREGFGLIWGSCLSAFTEAHKQNPNSFMKCFNLFRALVCVRSPAQQSVEIRFRKCWDSFQDPVYVHPPKPQSVYIILEKVGNLFEVLFGCVHLSKECSHLKSAGASLLFSGPTYECLPVRKKVEFQIQRGNLAVITAPISMFTYTNKNDFKWVTLLLPGPGCQSSPIQKTKQDQRRGGMLVAIRA